MVALCAACGGDGGGSVGDDGGGDGPLYAVVTGVESPDSYSVYLGVVPSLDDGVMDLDKAIEFPGYGRGYVGGGYVLFFSRETKTLSRFDLGSDGALAKTQELSFAGIGAAAGYAHYLASDERLYLPDFASLQFVTVNPSTMEIVSSSPIEGLGHEGFSADGENFLPLGDGRLVLPVWWSDWTNDRLHGRASALVILDPATGSLSVERVEEVGGCAGTYWGFRTDAGHIYAASAKYTLYYHWLDPSMPHSCAVRMPAGSDNFDPSYVLDLHAIAGNRYAGNLTYAGGSRAYMVALDEDRLSEAAATDITLRLNERAWRVWQVDLDEETAAPVAGIPYIDNAFPHYVDGQAYIRTHDDGQQTLYRVNTSGVAAPGLRIPGNYVYTLGRIR
jgi:hypothetical protein